MGSLTTINEACHNNGPRSVGKQVVFQTLKKYCQSIDSVISVIETLLQSQIELKNLTEVQNVLLENRLDSDRGVYQNAENNSAQFDDSCIPEEVKCPVCFEIYSNKIYLCLHGHSICSACRWNVNACPECRVSYNILVRNRALEGLISAGKLKINCPNTPYGCSERLKCREVQSHFRNCRYRKKSEELLKVESDIKLMEEGIRSLENNLDVLNTNCSEMGDAWAKVSVHEHNRLLVIQAKSQYQVRQKEMDKFHLNVKLKSLIYFNQ